MKTILKIMRKIFDFLVTLMIIIGLVIILLHIFGIKQYIVISGSMEPTIKTGSVVFINHNVSFEKLKEKDIIAFRLETGKIATHRIQRITEEGIVTKGDANGLEDGITTKKNYVGKMMFSIPYIGYIIKIFTTTKGILAMSMVFIMIVLICLLTKEEKKE